MNTSITISLAQVPVAKGNVQANLSSHLDMVDRSSTLGADVVVFPELSLIGYELELVGELAFSQEPSNFTVLSQAAIEHNVIVIVGCPLKVLGSVKPTIGAVICFPNGAVEFYSKQYLHEGEEKYCSSGTEDYLFNIKGYRVALAICSDFSSSEHSLKARDLGADIYIVSALISDSGFGPDAEILSNIAATSNFPVLLSNHISPTGGWSACGNNTVWDSGGNLVFGSESKESCVVVCSIKGHEINVAKT
jgi:predicted amidohydrolase